MPFGFFKKKAKETKDGRYFHLTLREVVPVAKDAVNLVFENPGESFVYQPGQFITLIDEVNGKKIRRAYSLCTTPFADEHPAVTVKRVPGGLMSNHVNDAYKAGRLVDVMEPMGKFTTTFDAGRARKAVFFGGGSGITPLYSLIRSMLIKEPDCKLMLVYGNRREEYIIFKREIEELASSSNNRFRVIHILEDNASGFGQISGRPSPGMVADLINEHNMSDAEFYICGPQPMMDVVASGLDLAGVDKEKIRLESFDVAKNTDAKSTVAATGDSEVTILLDGEEHVITVPKSRPILEVALENNLDMPYSCQSGLCTACRGLCTDGEVDLKDAEGLSPNELEQGYVLTCVGKPLSDQVRIEIG
jgi:ring-1,2-phenylacetyl-CoA epoxidase subunit PaaE